MMPLPSRDDIGLGGHRPLADINVTPLVDVMLVLLIVFMVTAPMLAAGLSVNLPQAATAKPVPPNPPVIVTVTREGAYLVGKDEVAREALAATVRMRLGDEPGRAVYIQGDREAIYGQVIAAVDLLTEAGLTKVVMMTERKGAAPAASSDSHDHHSAKGP